MTLLQVPVLVLFCVFLVRHLCWDNAGRLGCIHLTLIGVFYALHLPIEPQARYPVPLVLARLLVYAAAGLFASRAGEERAPSRAESGGLRPCRWGLLCRRFHRDAGGTS